MSRLYQAARPVFNPRRFISKAPSRMSTDQMAAPTRPSVQREAVEFFRVNVLKRNVPFVSFLLIAAMTCGYVYDHTITDYWKSTNKGKLFEDVIGTFPRIPSNCDDPDAPAEEE